MKEKNYKKLWLTSFGWAIFFFVFIDVALVFTGSQFYEAAHKPFWIDERNGLENNVSHYSTGSLLAQGAIGQGSPAPLDYIFLRFLHNIKDSVHSFGFVPEVYFRFIAIFSNVFCAFLVLFLVVNSVARNFQTDRFVKAVQIILLLCVPFAFLFSRQIYYYAAETRPYALWCALYFLTIALSFFRERLRYLYIVVLTLLAFTATASIYQILTLAAAEIIVESINGKNLRLGLIQAAKVYALPCIVSLFYCLKVSALSGGYPVSEWDGFWDLWSNKSVIIVLMTGVIVLGWLKKETRSFVVAPLAFLILYLLGPLLFWITKWKGFFYAERQYIYYDVANALLLLSFIHIVPAYARAVKNIIRYSVLFVLIAIGLSTTFRGKVNKKIARSFHQAWAVYQDPSLVRAQP